MAYDEGLADRIRDALAGERGLVEKKMFGGICFMLRGHMCVGVVKSDLMVRVGPDTYDDALSQPHARPMDFTGKPMKGMVYVATDGVDDEEALEAWLARAKAFVATLPPK